MIRKYIFALGALVASRCGAHAAPLDLYGKLPSIEQAEVSPSGKLVAYIITDGENRKIFVQSVPDLKPVTSAAAGATKLRDLTWVGDQHLILTTSTSRQPQDVLAPRLEWSIAFDLDLQQHRVRPLLHNIKGAEEAMNTIHGTPEPRVIDGKPFVFVRGEHFVSSLGQAGLFRVDLASHVATLVEPGRGRGISDWVVGPDGAVVAQDNYDDKSGQWSLMLRTGHSSWRAVQSLSAPIDTPSLMGLGRDGKSVLLFIDDDKLGSGWRELSIVTGAWGDLLPSTKAESAIHDPATGQLIGTYALVGDTPQYDFFDAHDAAVWRAVSKAFPGDLVTRSSWSEDRKKIVVRVDSAKEGPAYALVDLTTGKAIWLGAEYADLKPQDISPVKPVSYKAADGLEITGYLTIPQDRARQGLPLVVLVHGGPAARDEPGFDWEAQAIASRGYAVLQVNYRGSSGFGPGFYNAGFGEFGRKMQTDLSDGVRHLAREGTIDPKRVCIVGGSYGGYAALAGATLDRGVYRCAVSYAGPSDLRSQFSDSREKGGEDALRYWERYVGAKDLKDPVLAQISPAAHADQAEIPILLIHGRDDTVVTIAQSRRMAAALRRAGKPVEVVELPGEDHWLSRGETRQKMLAATVAFLERNNPPQ